ncbi:H-2 class II histocompatibility antigen, A-U alpha chain-like isoform X2 [Hoplias malabaricus]|uniref:H-2 class II histocompatibility antigen, A-U alpha chain-like isoform X2 n=1 Tax=Hoplias malabaricus TaxID=27720 RepID=UPI00346315E8
MMTTGDRSKSQTVKHRDLGLGLCSDSERERIYGLDGEEVWHADFSLEKGVMTLPQFVDPYSYAEGTYEQAVADIETCRNNLGLSIKGYNNPPIPKVAPQSSVYTKSSAQLGSKNTLICHITGFYPPHVEVFWTRNNVNVTDEASLSRYYINTEDGTFKLVSTLSFTPEEGDIYSCSVQHTALDRALTKTWEVDVELPGVGGSVFCGVGLAGGLLGVAVGTFFLIKGNNCN